MLLTSIGRGKVQARPAQVDGFCWTQTWEGPFESALSLVWKLSMANSLGVNGLADLFRRTMPNSLTHGPHPRSLLFNHWIDENPEVPQYFRRLVLDHGLPDLSMDEIKRVAGDEHIRYCPRCMDACYHSVFFQIDGLRRCPIHREALLDRCHRCGQKTGRYAVTKETIGHPYRCHHCHEPYGYGNAPPSVERFVSGLRIATAFDPIDALLKAYGVAEFGWLAHDDWLDHQYLERSTRRIATFDLLRRLLPNAIADDDIEQYSLQILEQVDGHAVVFPSGRKFTTSSNSDRENVFKEVDQYIVQQVQQRHHSRCPYGNIPLRYYPPFNDHCDGLDPMACPLNIGYQIWHHHFRGFNRSYQSVLRYPVSVWPYSTVVSNEMWGAFCLCAYFFYVEVAKKWALLIETDSDGRVVLMSKLRALTTLAVDLNYGIRSFPSNITYLSFHPLGHSERRSVMAVAADHISMDALLEDGCQTQVH
jgi:hypothetical protein